MASSMQTSSANSSIVTILAVMLVAIVAVAAIYLMQDRRSTGERLGDAVEALPQGVDKAANKLDDQPPAQNVERNLEKATD